MTDESPPEVEATVGTEEVTVSGAFLQSGTDAAEVAKTQDSTACEQKQCDTSTYAPFALTCPRNPDGSVNWRGLLNADELFPNKDWFERNKKEVPTSVEGLDDKQLCIMLGGIKRLAKLHGYTCQRFDVIECGPNRVVVKCSIDWLPRNDLGYGYSIHTESVANATVDNCDDFTVKFLETIAENRAFVRCVRNFLGINVVGYDEIDKNKGKRQSEMASERSSGDLKNILPSSILSRKFNGDFDGAFKEWLRGLWGNNTYRHPNIASWNSFEDIPPQECLKLMALPK